MNQLLKNCSLTGQQIRGYEIKSLLGKGAFGSVFKGLQIRTQQFVAIKMIEIERFKESDGVMGQLVQSEIRALELVKSDHVIGFVETFSDTQYCYIVMEYCDSGDLEQQLKNPNIRLTEQDALSIIKQILKGLRDLHAQFIIHRDLKLQNILVHNNSIYKIADLGFCKLLSSADQQSVLQLGSLYTMAPEIFNQEKYGLSSDMFSVGVIFYQILYNRYPFKQIDYIQNKQPEINFQKNKIEVSDHTQDLLTQMLQFNPVKRISFEKLINHPAFGKPIFSMISKIQLQANRIPFDDYEKFYIENSQTIEANLIDRLKNQPIQPPKIEQLQVQKSIRITEIKDNYNHQNNQFSLEIEKINKKINEMYFFSNTFQEIIHIFQIPNIMALLCLKLQKMCESILGLISDNYKKYQNNKIYELDFRILEEQYREMASLSEGILYQFYDIKEQLLLYNEQRLESFISQNITDEQFNQEFADQLQKQLEKNKQRITVAFAHVILCYIFCQTQNSEIIQFDETTFNLRKSKDQYIDQDHLLLEFNQVSQSVSLNFYEY